MSTVLVCACVVCEAIKQRFRKVVQTYADIPQTHTYTVGTTRVRVLPVPLAAPAPPPAGSDRGSGGSGGGGGCDGGGGGGGNCVVVVVVVVCGGWWW